MKANLKNLIVAIATGLVIIGAAAFSISPAMAHGQDSIGYDVGVAGQVVNVAYWDKLNVRKWPASYSQKIGEFAPDTIVYIERCIKRPHVSDWCKVGRDNVYGWVNSRYLAIIGQN